MVFDGTEALSCDLCEVGGMRARPTIYSVLQTLILYPQAPWPQRLSLDLCFSHLFPFGRIPAVHSHNLQLRERDRESSIWLYLPPSELWLGRLFMNWSRKFLHAHIHSVCMKKSVLCCTIWHFSDEMMPFSFCFFCLVYCCAAPCLTIQLMHGMKPGVRSFVWNDWKSSKETKTQKSSMQLWCICNIQRSHLYILHKYVRICFTIFPVWIITWVSKGATVYILVHNVIFFLSSKVWEVWKVCWPWNELGDFYLWQLVTFSLLHHWWPWIQLSLLVSGHQWLQRRSCEHFGFATDHLTLGRPACGGL